MKRFFSLTNVVFKSSLASFKVSKNKFLNVLFIAFLLISVIVPLFFIFNTLFKDIMEIFIQLDQEAFLISTVLSVLSIAIFLFALLQIPYIYYFSNDVETYLALPIKPYEILLSKLLVVVIYEYILVFIVMVPFLLTHFQLTGNFLAVILGILISFIIPAAPVVLASLIIILLLNFVPFLKNKKIINIIIGTLTIAVAVVVNLAINNSQLMPEDIAQLLLSGNNSLTKTIFSFLPHIRFASDAIVNNSFMSFILFLLVTAGLLVLYLLFSQTFYLNGATTISDSARSKKRFSQQQLTNVRQSSLVMTFAKLELKTLFRVPAYLMNGVFPIFLFPILILVIPFFTTMNSDEMNLEELTPIINRLLNDTEYGLPIAILAGVLLSLFLAASNGLSVTAVSREAKVLGHLKAYPIDHFKMILGKLLVNVFLAFGGVIFVLIVINLYLRLPLIFNLISMLCALITLIFANSFGILLDLRRPNIKWTNEVQVIKQGVNLFIYIFGMFLLLGILIYFGVNFMDHLIIYAIGLILFLTLSAMALLYYLSVNTSELLLKIDV